MASKIKYNYFAFMMDVIIIGLAIYVSVWQNNPNYLWIEDGKK